MEKYKITYIEDGSTEIVEGSYKEAFMKGKKVAVSKKTGFIVETVIEND